MTPIRRRLFQILQQCGIAAGFAFATAAAPAAVSVNGAIAYTVCDYSGVGFSRQCDIWTMNADGTGQTNVTNTPEWSETGPVWSPDGLRIAYSQSEPEGYLSDLWVMNADGTGRINFTNDPAQQFGPSWSPGGRQIVYVKSVPGIVISDQFDLFIHDLDTGVAANLTRSDFDELSPAWSPDGALIAFAGVRIAPDPGWATWEIVTVSPTGSDERILTAPPGRLQEDREPYWSPDGSKIVFMSQFNDPCCETWEIWAMNRDGSGLTNLTQHPSDDMFPSWSPDGTQILFQSTRDGSFGYTDVYTMAAPTVLPPPATRMAAEAGGAKARRLTTSGSAGDANWGPKAQRIKGPFSLQVGVRGAGRVETREGDIACGTDCSETLDKGSRRKLIARPDAGQVFAGWFGACSGTTPTCTVRMNDVRGVVARFKPAAGVR